MPASAAAALDQAERLFKADAYAAAASAAQEALDLSKLSKVAVLRGKALMAPLMQQIKDEARDDPPPDAFREAWNMFQLATNLDPNNDEAKQEAEDVQGVFDVLPEEVSKVPRQRNHLEQLDVIVVGAGASGVGVGLMLTRGFGIDPGRVLLLERGDGVGETFRRWPKEMRFISPSFNSQGWTASFDLNSVAYGTSPAYTLHAEHPTGEQYAHYLKVLAETAGLQVQVQTEVTAVRPFAKGSGFEVMTVPAGKPGARPRKVRSRYVIWAAGEFQYPGASQSPLFPGSEHCLHNSSVRSWTDLPGDDFVVIGGYESGMDAAYNLATCGKNCTVVSSTACWRVHTDDPSTELSPYTAERIRVACARPTPPRKSPQTTLHDCLLAPLRVFKVDPPGALGGDGFLVHARWGAPAEHKGGEHRSAVEQAGSETVAVAAAATDCAEGTEVSFRTPQAPLLCAGFQGSLVLGVVKELFEWGGELEEEEGEEEEEASAGKKRRKQAQNGRGKTKNKRRRDDDAVEAHAQDEGGRRMEKDKKSVNGCAESSPLLNEYDESTKTPGLFLVGPAVRHGELSFCFVYKFRQRFGIVADAIARGLGMDTEFAVEKCREINMFLDNFTCCKGACGETC